MFKFKKEVSSIEQIEMLEREALGAIEYKIVECSKKIKETVAKIEESDNESYIKSLNGSLTYWLTTRDGYFIAKDEIKKFAKSIKRLC